MQPSDLYIDIVEPGIHSGIWDKLKTWLWNFVLPPHIRLKIVPKPEKEKNA